MMGGGPIGTVLVFGMAVVYGTGALVVGLVTSPYWIGKWAYKKIACEPEKLQKEK